MFFTQEDYKKIQSWLQHNAIKDTEFNEVSLPLNGKETLTIIQGTHNVKVFLKDFVNQLMLLGSPDFLNISDKFGETYISLAQAIKLIPFRSRKIGQVITFIDEGGEWKIYQFQGKKVNQWNNIDLWTDLLEAIAKAGTFFPDEEDITGVVQGNKMVLKFKDKHYNKDDYSGLGKIYLRKNITIVEDASSDCNIQVNLLTQSMFGQENTIYIIQYDYSLNGQTITIPEGSVLKFQGGSFSNGTLNFKSNCNIVADEYAHIFKDIDFEGSNLGSAYVDWFGATRTPYINAQYNNSKYINKAFDSPFKIIKFGVGYYYVDDTLVLTKLKEIQGVGSNPSASNSSSGEDDNVLASASCLWTDRDINVLEIRLVSVYSRGGCIEILRIINGTIDVSRCKSYNHNVITFFRSKAINLHPVVTIDIIGNINRDSLTTDTSTGCGIVFTQEEGTSTSSGAFYGGYIQSFISLLHTAVKVDMPLHTNNLPWFTNMDFNCWIWMCRYSYNFGESGNNGGTVRGYIQAGGFYTSANEEVSILGNIDYMTFEAVFWDFNISRDNGYTPRYIFDANTVVSHAPEIVGRAKRLIGPKEDYIKNVEVLNIKNNNRQVIPTYFATFGSDPIRYVGIMSNCFWDYAQSKVTNEHSEGIVCSNDNIFTTGCTINVSNVTDVEGAYIKFTIDTSEITGRLQYFILNTISNTETGNYSIFRNITIEGYNSSNSVVKSFTFRNETSEGKRYVDSYFTFVAPAIIDSNNIAKVVVTLSDLDKRTTNPIITFEGSTKVNNYRHLCRYGATVNKNRPISWHGSTMVYNPYSVNQTNESGVTNVYYPRITEIFDSIEEAKSTCTSRQAEEGATILINDGNRVHVAHWVNNNLVNEDGIAINNFDIYSNVGTTAQRPDLASLPIGFEYFDTDLNYYIYKGNNNRWVDITGHEIVTNRNYTFSDSTTGRFLGDIYKNTDINQLAISDGSRLNLISDSINIPNSIFISEMASYGAFYCNRMYNVLYNLGFENFENYNSEKIVHFNGGETFYICKAVYVSFAPGQIIHATTNRSRIFAKIFNTSNEALSADSISGIEIISGTKSGGVLMSDTKYAQGDLTIVNNTETTYYLAIGAPANILINSNVRLTLRQNPNRVVTIGGGAVYRPTGVATGFMFYDTSISKPLWWTSKGWIDATGAAI